MFYKKGGGDIWSILTLNNVFFLGKMEKTRVAEGGFTYSHNIISIYHPKWWFFGEDQGPKMKNKPNFFLITGVSQTGGVGGGGSAAWEFFPHNPVFFLITSLRSGDTQPWIHLVWESIHILLIEQLQYRFWSKVAVIIELSLIEYSCVLFFYFRCQFSTPQG